LAAAAQLAYRALTLSSITMTPRCSVLLVDDDPKLCALVGEGLSASGVDCTVAPEGPAALALLAEPDRPPFDVVLLDIMMPQLSGWDLLAQIRGAGHDLPVIFVTARESIDERVRGLRLGADDYIIKPFAFAELLARIDAVVRRRHQNMTLRLGELHLDVTRRLVAVGDRHLDLSPKEFDLLRHLVEARSRTSSRRELLEQVWQILDEPGTNVVEVHVARLRRKLAIAGGPWIRTVRGKGYTLSATAE
jgi:two-component system copper resistance phosphate regulon response regulator CusR